MTTLTELMARDNVTAAWFWTHEVSTGPSAEHEFWDVVFVRDTHEPKLWVTDADTRRTAYFQGIGGCQADSRRETGGKRRRPDPYDTLCNLLSDAQEIDEYPTFRAWVEYHDSMGSRGAAWEQLDTYETLTRQRNTLRTWLPDDAYTEYINADRD